MVVRLLGPVPSDFGENVEEEDGTNERDGQHEDDEWVSIKPTEIMSQNPAESELRRTS